MVRFIRTVELKDFKSDSSDRDPNTKARYSRHVDSRSCEEDLGDNPNNNGRILTMILYLPKNVFRVHIELRLVVSNSKSTNEDWNEKLGGVLRIYPTI